MGGQSSINNYHTLTLFLHESSFYVSVNNNFFLFPKGGFENKIIVFGYHFGLQILISFKTKSMK